jgi:hypothetical protein
MAQTFLDQRHWHLPILNAFQTAQAWIEKARHNYTDIGTFLTLFSRVAHLHSFDTDPDLVFFLKAEYRSGSNPDPGF